MTVHYRRRPLSRLDEIGALSLSLLAGVGGAAAAYYLTRLYLSRERLSTGEGEAGVADGGDGRAVGPGTRVGLPAAGGTSNADD